MSAIMTQSEAETLIRMLKKSLVNSINFPEMGEKETFKVQGDTTKDLFDIQIYRNRIDDRKINYEGIVSVNKIPILELHIGNSLKHRNPDGTILLGSHWHIYTQEYGRQCAFPASDLLSSDFEESTLRFFKEFNIISPPTVVYQQELMA